MTGLVTNLVTGLVTVGWVLLALAVVGLLVPAALLTVARLDGSSSGGWVLLRSFTPLAVVPYAGAVLLLGVAVLGGRGGWRVVAAVVGVLALAGLCRHVAWASGPFVGSPPSPGAHELRVMTANLHLGLADGDDVVAAARRHRVDLLVLEEVTPAVLATVQADGARSYPYAAGRPAEGRDGLVVLSDHPLRDVRTLPTSTPGRVVEVRVAGRVVRLVAVHPISPNNGFARWAEDQATIRRAATGPGPTVLAGDFNATMDHEPLLRLVHDGYRDAATQARSGWQPTWPADGRLRLLGHAFPPLLALDHVLVRGGLRAVSTSTVAVPGSDHRALVAVLGW